MKKLILLLSIFFSLTAFSQDCNYPWQFCTDSSVTLPMAMNSQWGSGPEYGCISGLQNSNYYSFQVASSGNFTFYLSGTAGGQLAAICWGPLSSPFSACSGSQLNSGNIVDCSYSSSIDTLQITNALSGQFYILCVINYQMISQNLNVSIDSASTGAIYCDSTKCNISNTGSICYVSPNDSLKNEVYFNHTDLGLKGTIVYRQNAMSTWDSIGYVPSNFPDKFIDPTANPNQQSYTYCISQLDSCGNIRPKSPMHRTILLQSSLGSGTQINLSWSGYGGLPVSSYYIYRGSTPSNMSLINQVSSTTYAYTDLTPPPGFNYYKVSFDAPSCSSNSPHDTLVGSNYRDNSGMTTVQHVKTPELFSLYPNPAQKNINVEQDQVAKSIEVADIVGNILLLIQPKSKLETINLESLSKGVYFIKVVNSQGALCKKFIIE